jgi:hypothetical protein
VAGAAEARGDPRGVKLFVDEDLSPTLVTIGRDRGYDASEAQRAMRPMGVVVINEDAEHALEVSPVHDQ